MTKVTIDFVPNPERYFILFFSKGQCLLSLPDMKTKPESLLESNEIEITLPCQVSLN